MIIPAEYHHSFWLARIILWVVFGLISAIMAGILYEIFWRGDK